MTKSVDSVYRFRPEQDNERCRHPEVAEFFGCAEFGLDRTKECVLSQPSGSSHGHVLGEGPICQAGCVVDVLNSSEGITVMFVFSWGNTSGMVQSVVQGKQCKFNQQSTKLACNQAVTTSMFSKQTKKNDLSGQTRLERMNILIILDMALLESEYRLSTIAIGCVEEYNSPSIRPG